MTKQALRPKGTEALCRLLEEPDATAALNESLLPAFPYVEPGFLRSEDYRQIEQHIWTQIRRGLCKTQFLAGILAAQRLEEGEFCITLAVCA
jgi:hypothetical protein